ncbi:HAAS signaling domain-containing protein [Pontibacillus litoralis]|uniref:Uncharacterized protein n=1 Tax=Pontibacillus litoralis JSM 072002 TaxID=1385512 RepID=A0A0A5HL13_9BACI|nr:DUF1700 domain-containing protein [Pontibacillus litoralis]KGX84327.1 hypothetical protein N784_13675 [Pontibacillus litoralis JSM 072002]
MSSTINGYLSKLSDNLKSLPEEERESIVWEIEIHLKDRVNSLENEGYSNDEAVSKILSEFKSPYSLSKDYLEAYDEIRTQQKPTISYFLLNIGIMGLAILSLPILERELELAWIVLGLPEVICGLITLIMLKKKDTFILSFLKIGPKILLSMYFPISLLFFWIALIQGNGFVSFSLYYMVAYWLLLLIYYLVIKNVSSKRITL